MVTPLIAVGHHPFWNETDAEWQEARHLDVGDLVRTADGDLLAVDGIEFRSARWARAFEPPWDPWRLHRLDTSG